MSARRRPLPFELSSIADFDARRSLKRCTPPGVAVGRERHVATADLWRHADGRLFVRFASRGFIWSMECTLPSGGQIPDGRIEELTDWLADVLLEWIIDGVDDAPEPRS